MEDSILESIKKLLGINGSDDSFDVDIIMHINTTLSILLQLGIGPSSGFRITGSYETWSDFISDKEDQLEMVKDYVFHKVKLMFDPPLSASAIESINRILSELEWRINSVADYSS